MIALVGNGRYNNLTDFGETVKITKQMNLAEINTLLPLLAAGLYTLLLIASFARRHQHETQTRWVLAFLSVAIIWEFVTYFAAGREQLPNLPLVVLLVDTTFLGMITAVFANWNWRRLWLLIGVLATILVLFSDTFIPANNAIPLPNSNRTLPFSGLIATGVWLLLSGYLLLRTWHDYKRTDFPWHANRLLYWAIVLFTIFLGEAFLFAQYTGLTMAGQLIRIVGVAGIAYASVSHRIVNVRAQSQSAATFITITLISALPLAGAILLVQWLTRNQRTSLLFSIAIITISLFLYPPFRRSVEGVATRYFLGEGVNTSQVLRNYSRAVYTILDVNQLSSVTVGTLSELLGTRRGALLLVSDKEEAVEIEPIPAQGDIPRNPVQLPPDSLFLKTLTRLHQPLLQYELDFNREFAGLHDSERQWLSEMAMEVYVPVSAGKEISGLIAIGPKSNGVPYQPGELDLMQLLADQTVVALQNARLYSALESQNEKIRHLNNDLRTQNERLEIMDQVKSDFITIASHELRTPLTQVKGYTDILQAMNEESELSQQQTQEILGHIDRAGNRLDGVITAMLDASQLDAEALRMNFVQTTVDTVLRMATDSLQEAIRERHIYYETADLDKLPPIHADLKRLVQAFNNLVGNAIKYTPDYGRVWVQGKLIPGHDGTDECIELIIADSGIGIDPKFHELVFEKFFRVGDPQLHSTGSTKFKGAGPGLGLPIAKGVIEGHGGRIWVESEGEDEERLPGSEFHVILPLRPPAMDLIPDLTELTETADRPAYLIG